jgi:hypothetical protein
MSQVLAEHLDFNEALLEDTLTQLLVVIAERNIYRAGDDVLTTARRGFALVFLEPFLVGVAMKTNRPNITGLNRLTRDLSGKRLELLTELVPGMSRVAVLWDVDGSGIGFKEYGAAARALKVQL